MEGRRYGGRDMRDGGGPGGELRGNRVFRGVLRALSSPT
jgi:hypothetical protein